MCGIISLLSIESNNVIEKRAAIALDSIRRRGPDAHRSEIVNYDNLSIMLGHARLSIIDLSDDGVQPLTSWDARYKIIFNGEVYNYIELRIELKKLGAIFKTGTDTEVLVEAWRAWGVDCLRKIEGMFAFILLDKQTSKLYVARDGFGIKPLYYKFFNNEIAFSSEPQTVNILLGCENSENIRATYEYLVLGSYDRKSNTMFDGVFQVPPGSFAELDLRAQNRILNFHKWWNPLKKVNKIKIDFIEAKQHVRDIFLKNVKRHLRADVKVGAALSGGIDSSAIVCAAHYISGKKIDTFSYAPENFSRSELKWARIVNDHTNSTHHYVDVNPKDLLQDLNSLILAQKEPFGSTSIYAQYVIYKTAKEAGVTVTLDGQGADELLGGYLGYPSSIIASKFDKLQLRELLTYFKAFYRNNGRHASKEAAFVALSRYLPPSLYNALYNKFKRDTQPGWINADYLARNDVAQIKEKRQQRNDWRGYRLTETLLEEQTAGGLQALLRHGDRNSMWWSVESRTPFLTIDFSEFLSSIDESYLVSNHGTSKHIFREAMRGIVPDVILDRKDKVGFETPEIQWLGSMKNELMAEIEAIDSDILDKSSAIKEINAALNGETHFDFRVWRIVNYCKWKILFSVK